MELDKIGGMSQGDLRRFIVALLHSDPGALPRHLSGSEALPKAPHTDGDVPVWDAASSAWVPSSQHKVPYSALNLSGSIVNTDVAAAAGIFGSKLTWSRGTSPPGSPTAGDIWIYNGATFYWMFVYDSLDLSAFKWKFVGGSVLWARVAAYETTNSTTPVDLATVGPSITLPRSGEYVFNIGADIRPGANSFATAQLKVGAAAIVGDEIATAESPDALAASVSQEFVHTNATAADVAKLQYADSAGVTSTFGRRWIRAYPVRVS